MMSQIFTIYSLFFLVAALVSFFVAFLAWQRRFVKGSGDLIKLMLASGIWAFWIILETAAPTMEGKIFWAKLGYFGAVSTPVFYLIFVLRFTGERQIYFNQKSSVIVHYSFNNSNTRIN